MRASNIQPLFNHYSTIHYDWLTRCKKSDELTFRIKSTSKYTVGENRGKIGRIMMATLHYTIRANRDDW